MKRSDILLGVAVLGALAALLAYDRLVLEKRAAALAVAMAKATEVNLSKAHAEADRITANLDASVDRSIADAREGMDALASEQDKRRLATEALGRASMFKVALAEYYLSMGKWPASTGEAGLGSPADYAGGAVDAIDVGAGGVITIALNASLVAGAKIRLAPDANPRTSIIDWRCHGEGPAELQRYLPAVCKG
ncbi:MAG TPA: pilin [Lysobacter sp.]